MAKINYLAIVLISIIFVFYSCKKSSNPVEPPVTDVNRLVPLNIGNSWTYKVTRYDTAGVIERVDTLTYFIRNDTVVNDTKWYILGVEGGVLIGQTGRRNDTSGYHTTDFRGNFWLYPYPAQVGTSDDGITVLAVDSLIETNTDTLSCYVYKRDFTPYISKLFYAPGYGRVYEEDYLKSWSTNQVYQISELISSSIVIEN